jgi:HNH endonuclease
MSLHRKIWKKHFGKIPRDIDGRTYEIHHKDGNRKNNDINNLMCISMQEHYNIHYKQGDWGAVALISKRMGLPIDHISKIQTGKKRPELIGKCGPKLGNIPWNKNKKGYKLNTDRTGKRFGGPVKLSKEDVVVIKNNYSNKINLVNSKLIGTKAKNGRTLTYDNIFCKQMSEQYKVSIALIRQIINNKTWKDEIIDVRK